jgi:nucleoid-associated protein YgaU
MMKTIAWMLLPALLMVSCSRTKSAKSVSQDTPQIALSDADEFTETDPLADTDSSLSIDDSALSTETTEAGNTPVLEDAEPVVSSAAPVGAVKLGEGEGEYIVQKNETLMMIAFKLYGDYGLWRDLSRKNASAVKNGIIPAGAKIKYTLPSQTFEWSPQGNPYLIRTGDTLGGISGSVYGTTKKWKSIWDNNKPLIKDPNRIFAGFTIYWLEQGKVPAGSYEL